MYSVTSFEMNGHHDTLRLDHDINGLLEVRQHSGKMEKRRGFFFSRLTINLR